MKCFNQAITSDLYASCITFGEVYKGIELLTDITKRKLLETRTTEILENFDDRILIVTLDTTLLWAKLLARGIKNPVLMLLSPHNVTASNDTGNP
jgi:hypothetical protein